MASSMVAGEKELNVDPNVWKACAGSSVEIPVVGSLVYYFIEGHVEHAGTNLKFSSMNCTKPYVLCKIIYVRFLANPETDEVFTKMGLEPIDGSCAAEILPPRPPVVPPVSRPVSRVRSNRHGGGEEEDDDNASKIVSFAKILTISDANNGGGFSVPRFCADSIFPELNYKVEPPVQTISLRDVHGMVWEFRHIYRGTPRRHLLTTGWSKFVNHKKLVAYDSVVFMKNGVGELFVGIRRYLKKSEGVDNGRWSNPNVKLEGGGGDGFSRRNTGRVSAQSVLEAVKLALENKPFEIVSYPKAGSPAFVVKAETVDASMNIYWTSGMRIKTAVESEDSSRMTWFQGTISSVAMQNSPWCMLQVTWDEPELHSLKRVSPWQVELVATNPSLQAPFPPTKRQRIPQDPGFLTDEKGGLFFPMTGLTNSMTGHLNSPLLSYNNFPAGMQGARHDPICVSKLSNYMGNNNHNMLPSEHISGNSTSLTLSSTATELSIRNTSQSENMSPNSQGSVHFVGSEFFGNQTCNTATKAGNGTVLLFGKIIHTYQPVEAGINDGKGAKDDGSREKEETEGVINPLNQSLSYPCKQLCDGIDVQFKSVPALKQFLL